VSMHRRPLARASAASSATSVLIARSLMRRRPYRPGPGTRAPPLLIAVVALVFGGVVDAQQPHRGTAGEHDDGEQRAVDRRADQQRHDHGYDDDRQADEAGDHAVST